MRRFLFVEKYRKIKASIASYLFVAVILLLGMFFGLSFIVALLPPSENQQAATQDVRVELSFDSDPVQEGQLNEMTLRLLAGSDPIVNVVPSENKYLHVFIASDDLVLYGHDHPDDYNGSVDRTNVESGTYHMPILFPRAGSYSIGIRFNTSDGKRQTTFQTISVTRADGSTADKQVNATKDMRAEKEFDDYVVRLKTSPAQIETCKSAQLAYTFEQNGTLLSDLEQAPNDTLSVAAWGERLTSFTAAPANIKASPSHQQLIASLLFTKPGGHQVFSEFQHNGKVIPTSFFVDVTGAECE